MAGRFRYCLEEKTDGSKQLDKIQATSRYVLRKPKGVQKVDSYTYILYKM